MNGLGLGRPNAMLGPLCLNTFGTLRRAGMVEPVRALNRAGLRAKWQGR